MQVLQKLKPLALLVLRIALGVLFILHGYPKLHDPGRWMAMFPKFGYPGYFAYITGVLEVFGGALLILGLVTRVAGLLLAIEMCFAVAALTHAHIPYGANYEVTILLGAGALALAGVGAGLLSVDHAVFESKWKR